MSFSSWRGVVGMVNPTMRPGMTEEVCRLLPEGIGLIPLFLNINRGTQLPVINVVAFLVIALSVIPVWASVRLTHASGLSRRD